jgi:hypothetical protein
VAWDSLDKILATRGFDDIWRRWVAAIVSTGKTAVILNGVPGHRINCKCGLHQADPLYLYIIVADVLQRLV